MRLAEIRTAAWHLRKGGIRQLSRYLELQEAERMRSSEKEEDKRALAAEQRARLRGFDPLDFAPWQPNPNHRAAFSRYTVGAILDEFSVQAWGNEFQLELLDTLTWREQIDGGLDFVLIESAWQGNGGQWRYQVVGSEAPSQGLRDLIAYCKQRGVPTVFWNKEDPTHFEDFIDVAVLVDVVATTDAACVPAYRQRVGHERVIVVPFAAQTAIHHPMRDQAGVRFQRGDLCFAGTYFRHKFEDRRAQMDRILVAGLEAAENLHQALTIYSRNEDVDEKYSFPAPYSDWVVGSLDYPRMLAAYRGYKAFLNVNTVTTSPTMFSRRVVEIAASGTLVISTPAQGLESFFEHSSIPTVSPDLSAEEAAAVIESFVRSPFTRDRLVHLIQRDIWEHHTYSHRAARILDALGLDATTPEIGRARVAVIMSTNKPELVDDAIARVLAQSGVDVHLYLATHGFARPDLAGPQVSVTQCESSLTLGECLNTLVDMAEGEFVAKMDDDDYYGPTYLRDQVNALRYSGADVVGKQAAYLYLESTNELVLRKKWREHMSTDLVLGATLVGRMETFRQHRFTAARTGEDTEFLRAVRESGGSIYSADRFNYIQIRSATGHTWDVADAELKRNGEVVTLGRNTDHVDVPEA